MGEAPTGSCYCERVKYEYTGNPLKKAICHCLACRKLTGSSNSVNILVPKDKFRITSGSSSLKSYSKPHESGMDLTIFFCGDCGTVTYKELDADMFQGTVIVQAGTLDDMNALNQAQPDEELYIKHRASWLPKIPSAGQMQEFA